MKKFILITLLVFLSVGILFTGLYFFYDPSSCAICSQSVQKKPFAVSIYSGTATLLPECSEAAGCTSIYHVNTPGFGCLNPVPFCRQCKKKLPLVCDPRLVIVDPEDQQNIYLFSDDVTYRIQNYIIFLDREQSGGYTMKISGTQ